MSESLIKLMFSIIGTLLVSIILFTIIFTATGQSALWRAIEPGIVDQWNQCTMNNGAERTKNYEEVFDKFKAIEYSRNTNTIS